MSALLALNIDETQLASLAGLMKQAGSQAPLAIMRAINWTGDRAYTQIVRSLTAQTGAMRNVVVKRVVKFPASLAGRMVFRIVAKSPAMPLSDFAARNTRKGVSAAPWRQRRVFPHAFIVASLGGRVFIRTGKGRAIRQVWGPVIANDMVRGETRATFEATVTARLLPRLEHELNAILSGNSPRAAP